MKYTILLNRAKSVLMGLVILSTFSACEKIFHEEEQYRKEIYIVSDNNNVFGQEFTFGEAIDGFLSIYAAGNISVDKDVKVLLERNEAILNEYNKRVNGTNYSAYSLELPEDAYSLPDGWEVTLTPENPYSLFPIRVNINDLLPDERYYIPVSIQSVSDYQFSERKSDVLFRVFFKNDYATTKTDTYYSMNGTILDLREYFGWGDCGTTDPTVVNATKLVTPISENSIRILPATMNSRDRGVLNRSGIKVEVTQEIIQVDSLGDDGLPTGITIPCYKVNLSPYMNSNSSVKIMEASDGIDQNNPTKLPSYYNPKNNMFVLNYCYRMPDEKFAFDFFGNRVEADKWHKVREEFVRLK
ncbi:DUF4361 domain-containing protein [uncultured Proteiniphilum sp.]|uniref:BT_3987 domain-containing protein n=1 Tax=uncultured Proteiniphilum sp. TaxID=497637 RepID=UPI0026391F21|nr:DUF4361 domain-containing protein [uncultured Proteiniphilum sp.]